MSPDPGPTGDFLTALRRRAAAERRRIALPEATDPRILVATERILREGLADPVLIGVPGDVVRGLRETGIDPDAVEIIDSSAPGRLDRTFEHLRARREGRGDPESTLRAMAADPLMQAGAMVATDDVHGAVGGCVRTTADVVRAGLVTIGLAGDLRTLSSAFYMVFDEAHRVGPSVLTFTDAGVVPEPSPEQLSDIARAAAGARPLIVGDDPRVAFLSFSTLGSAESPSVLAVREALRYFREASPDTPADGELQGDAALSDRVAARKAPGSRVAGQANVLVFPDLDAANIAYKLVQHLGGATALGPILQGLDRPFNDLSRGAEAGDIVDVVCITALMAGGGS